MPLIAIIGGVIGGSITVSRGRRYVIILTNVLFTISWFIMLIANSAWYIFIGRFVVGIGVGTASLVLPIYLAEILEPEVRGMFGLFPTVFGNGGILICFIIGGYFPWRVLVYIGVGWSIPFLLITYFFLPETPNWLISKSKDAQARDVLIKIRATEHVEEELIKLKENAMQSDDEKKLTFKELLKPEYRNAIKISLSLMFFQQLSGINAVIYYTTTIFKLANSSIDEKHCTIVIGVVNLIATVLATLIIDRLGRKKLLYISSASMIVTIGTLSLYFYHMDHLDNSTYGWIPLASLVLYVLGFSFGFGPIPWLMMGEILPAKVKAKAASLSTAFNFLCTFFVTKTFPLFLQFCPIWLPFSMYCIVCVIAVFFVRYYVPETSGRSLEDIEKELSAKK